MHELRREGAHPLCHMSRLDLDPIKLAYSSQYAGSPATWAHCYAELDVSSPAMTETIATPVLIVL